MENSGIGWKVVEVDGLIDEEVDGCKEGVRTHG
jgi:hypothetical protein